jgi:exopolysaccharide production protein ExoZ
MNNKIVYGLQAGRAFAALAVVLFHAEGAYFSQLNVAHSGIFSFGHSGVHFFFVVSGFIISYSHRNGIGSADFVCIYWMRRLLRILPLFWLVMIAYGIKAILNNEWDAEYFAKSALLIPMSQLPLLVQSWTLTHEFIFYGFFSFYIIFGRKAHYLFAVWFSLILLLWLSDARPVCNLLVSCIFNVFLNPINLLFGFGMFAEYFSRKSSPKILKTLVYVGAGYLSILIFLEVTGTLYKGSVLDVLGYGVASFLIICGISSFTPSRVGQRIFSLFGNISFSVYLIHGMVISIVLSVMPRRLVELELAYPLFILIVSSLTVLISIGIYKFFEQPLANFAGPLTRRSFRVTG